MKQYNILIFFVIRIKQYMLINICIKMILYKLFDNCYKIIINGVIQKKPERDFAPKDWMHRHGIRKHFNQLQIGQQQNPEIHGGPTGQKIIIDTLRFMGKMLITILICFSLVMDIPFWSSCPLVPRFLSSVKLLIAVHGT